MNKTLSRVSTVAGKGKDVNFSQLLVSSFMPEKVKI